MTELARRIGWSYTALNARLAGVTQFTAQEIYLLACEFDVDPAVFFRPPLELVVAGHVPETARGLVRSTFWEPRRSEPKRYTPEVIRRSTCGLDSLAA